MKKVLSMIAALLLCVGTQAQIVSSRSAIVKTEKQASSTQWFLRAGLNIMNFSGDGAEGADSNIGYNATFGYQKPLGSTGGYWGMEFGLGSRGFKVEDTKCMAHNIQYSPFTFGWNLQWRTMFISTACRSLCQLRLHEQNESRRREHQLGRLRRLHGS